jgi:putative spermidine/putrescine transport system permease protein
MYVKQHKHLLRNVSQNSSANRPKKSTQIGMNSSVRNSMESSRARRSSLLMAALLAPAFLLVAAVVVIPTLLSIVDSVQNGGRLTLANYASFALEEPYLHILTTTLTIALVVTVLCVAISAPVAAFLAAQEPRRSALLLALIGASLWISVLVRIYSWQVLLARNGPINLLLQSANLTDQPIPFLYTREAVILSMIQFLVPYATLMMYAGMRRVDWEMVTAARTLGARFGTVFMEVYWPQVRFSVTTAGLVVFMIATSFFVSPALLGGPSETMLAMQMYSDLVNRYETGMAPTTGVVLTVILLVVAWVVLRLGGTSFRRLASDLDK